MTRLSSTVLYQIYPQSFADADGDGIGDLNGIRQRLDYLAWLGVDAIWLNPCFVSPFLDAGYDVADYLTVAPRYGTNDDLAALCAEAGRRGIAVLLDLVAGHTSDQHPWFLAACASDADPAIRDRFVWRDSPRDGWVAPSGTAGEVGYYLPNFLPCQPALNYGYARPAAEQPWRQPVDAPGPRANREALRAIMAHWFDLGVAGFRVDMAASLVKDDPGLVETGKLWREVRAWLEVSHPDRVLVAEWGDPQVSVPAGFHVDFLLHFGGPTDGLPLRSLWNNGAGTVNPTWQQDGCWADADGRGEAGTFVAAWREAATAIAAADPEGHYGRTGIVGLPTSNHDFTRLVAGPRDARQAAIAMMLVLTWPALPCLYYGDEIGMRYLPDSPALEGSRLGPMFERAGSRTPMRWGPLPQEFGPGTPAASRYLPDDPGPDAPSVAAGVADEQSLLHLVRRLIGLRHDDPRLDAGAPVEVLATGYPLAYTRGSDHSLLVVLNPSREPVSLAHPVAGAGTVLTGRGVELAPDEVRLTGFGYAIVDLRTSVGAAAGGRGETR
ncbi:MAG: alpha-amylase family glycosyl hydrolase [Propionicimonas sp.]|uniref:alpha-amylase family glycosyl hydrolase n=1 Tax=Propionicimonas sp. TaxID=1955623 RepID=UPI002B21CFF2|nr:alpha-amylase family glycosyl hydrolase [Propionicimonas sp.]MEA4943036.1 alpha-amylase family glycosyl hydrolase [Propionicimonas sp.]